MVSKSDLPFLPTSWEQVPTDSIHISLSNDKKTIVSGWSSRFKFKQTPALSLFADTDNYLRKNDGCFPECYVLTYRGIKMTWYPATGVWPPCLDSYFFVTAAVNSWRTDEKNVLEIGCGTGIIGLHFRRLTNCQSVFMIDRNPQAVIHTQANIELVGVKGVSVHLQEFPTNGAIDKKFDLLMCNPPYFTTNIYGNKYYLGQATGLELTEAILKRGLEYAHRVIFGYSSASKIHIFPHIERLIAKGAAFRILDQRRLPLIIPDKRKLLPRTQGVFHSGPSELFQLWHDVYTGELT